MLTSLAIPLGLSPNPAVTHVHDKLLWEVSATGMSAGLSPNVLGKFICNVTPQASVNEQMHHSMSQGNKGCQAATCLIVGWVEQQC